jgi:hypothetical protein
MLLKSFSQESQTQKILKLSITFSVRTFENRGGGEFGALLRPVFFNSPLGRVARFFLAQYTYQNGGKYTKLPLNYKMAVK